MSYAFDNDYSLFPEYDEPATEGVLGDIFSKIWEALKAFGNKIKDAINWVLDLGKLIKSKIAENRENKSGDPAAERLVASITKNINEMSKVMLAALKDKSGNNVAGNAKSLHSEKLRKALELSAETIADMKQLPKCTMSYKMASTAYMSLKALLADNTDMMKAVKAIESIQKDKDGKLTEENNANLDKFMNVHSKLRACVNALMNYLRKIAPNGAVAKAMNQFDKDNKGKKNPKEYADMGIKGMKANIKSDLAAGDKANAKAEKAALKIAKQYAKDPKVKEANGGKAMSDTQLAEYVEQRLADTTTAGRIAQLTNNPAELIAYTSSLINVSSMTTYLRQHKANESADEERGAMLYEAIRESVLEDLYNEALENADAAFDAYDDADVFDDDDDSVFDE